MHNSNNLNIDPVLFETLKNTIIKVIQEDGRTVPFAVLRAKTYKEIKKVNPNIFVKDNEFEQAVKEMKAARLISESQYNRFFIEYLDYKKSENFGVGYLEINNLKGNGFITIKKDVNEYKKSSHFVHKKNLNGAKNGDYVKFVELVVNNKKHFKKFSLIDAAVVEVLQKPEK